MISTSVLPLPLAPDYPREVRKQWERFVSGALVEGEKIRPLVSASWTRCQEAGLDPLQLPCAHPVSEEALASLRDGDLLYPHGTAVVEDLQGIQSP